MTKSHATSGLFVGENKYSVRLLLSYTRGVYPPNGNDANFPSPSLPLLPLSLPLPLTAISLPSPPLPVGRKMEIEIGLGALWRIFVSKRQLSSVSLFVNKN